MNSRIAMQPNNVQQWLHGRYEKTTKRKCEKETTKEKRQSSRQTTETKNKTNIRNTN